jgi:hypothetical protein
MAFSYFSAVRKATIFTMHSLQQTDFYRLTGWEKPGAIPIPAPEFDKKASGYQQR